MFLVLYFFAPFGERFGETKSLFLSPLFHNSKFLSFANIFLFPSLNSLSRWILEPFVLTPQAKEQEKVGQFEIWPCFVFPFCVGKYFLRAI